MSIVDRSSGAFGRSGLAVGLSDAAVPEIFSVSAQPYRIVAASVSQRQLQSGFAFIAKKYYSLKHPGFAT